MRELTDLSWPLERAQEIMEEYRALQKSDSLWLRFYEAQHSTQMLQLWREFVEQTSRQELNRRLAELLSGEIESIVVDMMNLPEQNEIFVRAVILGSELESVRKMEIVSDGLYSRVVACRSPRSFLVLAREIVDSKLEFLRDPRNQDPTRSTHMTALLHFWERWHSHVTPLTSDLAQSVREIRQEIMVWLKKHPDAVKSVAWEALEQIIAEIFASRGFTVDLTGRLRSASADIIAVRRDEFGIDTRYLIEVKHYAPNRPVGLSVVNQVLGAMQRRDVEHAFLVTTSTFTRDVENQRAKLADFRLHLRDGHEVRKWLEEYKVQSGNGLWLGKNWQD